MAKRGIIQFELNGNQRVVGRYVEAVANRIRRVKENCAREFYSFQVPSRTGGQSLLTPRWSGYFRACWNLAYSHPDLSVVTPARPVFHGESAVERGAGRYADDVDVHKAVRYFNSHGDGQENHPLDDPIYVTNNAYYAQWLERGGSDSEYGVSTFKRHWEGSGMLAAGLEHVKDNLGRIVEDSVARSPGEFHGGPSLSHF